MLNAVKHPRIIDSSISVVNMMNTDYQTLATDDSLRTVVQVFKDTKLDTLPVVDDNGHLIGVFPKGRLYKALLEGSSLNDSCAPYIVNSPVFLKSDLTYNEVSLFVRVNRSRVGNIPVVHQSGKVVGMIGKLEYLRASLNLATFSYAFLESIFRAIYEGMIVIDNQGYILRLNPAVENMFGIKAAEIRGLHLSQVFPEIHFSRDMRLGLKATIRSLPVILNQVPIIENGQQIGVNIALLDVSDIVKIAEELETVKELQSTLSGILNASSDGVFITDASGAIKYVNEMASHLVSEKTGQLIGKQLADYVNSPTPMHVITSGVAEVDVCQINGKNYIVSHIPIKEKRSEAKTTGIISTVLLNNQLTEEITRKWFSLRQQVQYYRDELDRRGATSGKFEQIVSRNPDFIKKKKEAQRIAQSSSTVLLTGESGVGKDMFARAIHSASPRAKHPFVKVNCAAIPETLLESELFGYAPGSFTGASKKGKPGYFEQANGGTILLDEIGDMPLSIQVKILQVLQEKEFLRVGGTTSQRVDVRIIAATNRDLREAISRGAFREDLFYRLNVIAISLPPLRTRSEDILPLAELFVEKYNEILGSNIVGISKAAQEALERHSWPGNIRELENAIERAANYAWEGEIELDHLPGHILHGPDLAQQSSYRTVLNDVDKDIIMDALHKTDGNKSAAARLLKISRSALYEKLAKYDIL